MIDEALSKAYNDVRSDIASMLSVGDLEKILASSFEDLQDTLRLAKNIYEVRKAKQSQLLRWLSRWSSRVMYYGNVLDVLAQHHPEYVSLVWGTMKFLLIGVLNHEEIVTELSKAFVYISEALPRAELKHELYNTKSMREALVQLYIQITRFSQRAIKWYTSSKLKHVYRSFLQPFSLSYKDIVEEIKICSARINVLAVDEAQVEQRQMYLRIKKIESLLTAHHGAIMASGVLNTPFQLRNIEMSQILTFVDKTPFPSPERCLKYQLAIAKRHQLGDSRYLEIANAAHTLRQWSSSQQSTLLMIAGTFQDRAMARSLAASTVDILRANQCPVVWTLPPKVDRKSVQLSSLDVLKHLTLQILQINDIHLQAHANPLRAVDFQLARTESDWFDLLATVIVGLPELYIVLDIETLRRELENGSAWTTRFVALFEMIMLRSPQTHVKVAIIRYHTRMESPKLVDGVDLLVTRLKINAKDNRPTSGRNKGGRLASKFKPRTKMS